MSLRKNLASALVLTATVGLAACTPSTSQLKKAVEENPDIVFGAIEKNPQKFIDVVNKAARDAQNQARESEQKEEEKRMEEEFKSPKTPVIEEGRAIFGKKDAPITIVEYSDFECPYCGRGHQTIKEVMKEFGDKVRIVYKHLPLDIHPMAMPAARYFEAIARQDHAKAEKFHNEIFENQQELRTEREKFLDKMAKKVGADMGKLKKDLDSDAVKKQIDADMEEAKKFGFTGTPGFLVNGVSIRGAYPASEFKKIIDRHLSKNTAG